MAVRGHSGWPGSQGRDSTGGRSRNQVVLEAWMQNLAPFPTIMINLWVWWSGLFLTIRNAILTVRNTNFVHDSTKINPDQIQCYILKKQKKLDFVCKRKYNLTLNSYVNQRAYVSRTHRLKLHRQASLHCCHLRSQQQKRQILNLIWRN